jgi:hypothetical protein
MTPKGPNPHPDSPDNVPARRNAKQKEHGQGRESNEG